MRFGSSTVTHRRHTAATLAALILAATTARAQANVWRTESGEAHGGHYADVNGIHIYYEIHGSGKPLVLLHGGLGAVEMFGPNLPALADGRRVIAVDLQGHGRTADIDRPLSVALMADDIAALVKQLGITRTDVMGYSLGGGVALQTAIRHPELLHKLVVVSTPFRRSAYDPDILVQQGQVTVAAAEWMKQTPMYRLYSCIAPRPQDWGDPARVDAFHDLRRPRPGGHGDPAPGRAGREESVIRRSRLDRS